MRILIVNKFLHHVGGVETYVRWQARHLTDAGHELLFVGMTPPAGANVMEELDGRYRTTDERQFNSGLRERIASGVNSIYSTQAYKVMSEAVQQFRPDVTHFHSTCWQLTPSVITAVGGDRPTPSIVTAHEYKLVCASQRLWDDRAMTPCEACIGATTKSRILNIASRRCVRGSPGPSLIAMAELPVADRAWRTSKSLIHCPSRFMQKVIQASPDLNNPTVYLDLPWQTPAEDNRGSTDRGTALYLGRLSPEKGVDRLLQAWIMVQKVNPALRLRIAGDGPHRAKLEQLMQDLGLKNVEFTGRYHRSEIPDMLRSAFVTVHPSIWHENSPFTVRESLQSGVPTIVADRGGMPEMVGPKSGTIVDPQSPDEIASAIIAESRSVRAATEDLRREVADRALSDEQHLQQITRIYKSLVGPNECPSLGTNRANFYSKTAKVPRCGS